MKYFIKDFAKFGRKTKEIDNMRVNNSFSKDLLSTNNILGTCYRCRKYRNLTDKNLFPYGNYS